MRRDCLAVLAAPGVATAAVAASDLGPVKEQAVRLYDRGRYDDALKSLEELDHRPRPRRPAPLPPVLLRESRRTDATKLERRSIAPAPRSRSEIAASASLEVAFYLANTYANLGLSSERHGAPPRP